MLDFDLASKTTGGRFVFVNDKLALLDRAIEQAWRAIQELGK